MEQALQSHRMERQKPAAKSHGTPSGTFHGSACDQCHRRKERCSGSIPCDRCNSTNNVCTYSLGRPLGKPKGRRNIVNTRNPARPVQHNPVSSSPAKDCITKKGSEPPKEMELDICDETVIFGCMTDDKCPQPPLQTTNPNTNTFGLFNPDALGNFQFILDGTSQQGPPLSSQSIGEITSELRHLAPDLGMSGNVNDNSTSQRTLTFAPTTQPWPGPGIPAITVNQNGSGILRRDFPLDIIDALYNQQKSISWAPISETLLIAREGLDAVSQFISDLLSLSTPASISSTIVIASLLILQQALACYMELHSQAAARFERGKDGESDSIETLCIGEFQIKGSESCRNVLEALVKAEVNRGRVILARLQQVADDLHKAGDDKTGLFEVAFRRDSASQPK